MTSDKEARARAAETKLKKYGEDYYKQMGATGGAKSKGRKLSAEHKRKISEAQKRRHNEDHISPAR